MNNTHRPSKRVLTASFLVTVSSLVACGGSSHEPEMTHNPPMPTGTALVVEPTPEPTVEVEPPNPPDAQPDPQPTVELQAIPANRPGRVEREGDNCVWVADTAPSGPCPPGAACNPPPQEAFPVHCPPEEPALPAAPAGAKVQTRDDGTCFYMPAVAPCRPGVRCNPPAPQERNVRCR